MRTGIVISSAAHAAILAWALVTFSAKPFDAAPVDSLPVDIVSISDFSRMVSGSKSAKKIEAPKPLVDKIGEPVAPKDPSPKVSEKKEVEAAAAEPPPPTPAPKPAEAKAEKKEPEPKVDQIAEALNKDTSKPPPTPVAHTPIPIKKPPPPQPKFDANKIAALLDKRDPQRQAATGSILNPTASLGTMTGNAATLSQNEIDALRARLAECWNPPAGVADAKELSVLVRIQLTQSGALAAEPTVTNRSANPLFQVAAESALRAVQRCAPFGFLPVAKYDIWRDLEVNFDPRDMFRG